MGSAGGGDSELRDKIEGVRVPCWDAKRRVWQAIELLERERRIISGRTAKLEPTSSPQGLMVNEPDQRNSTGR